MCTFKTILFFYYAFSYATKWSSGLEDKAHKTSSNGQCTSCLKRLTKCAMIIFEINTACITV